MQRFESDTVVDPWLLRLGDAWAALLRMHGLARDGFVIEGAPGASPKVALGLARCGFEGTVHLVEASPVASALVAAQYQRLLPRATVRVLETRLAAALGELPRSCDALLMNHVLDDLILGHALSDLEFRRVFDRCSADPASVEEVRALWRRAESAGDLLMGCVGMAHDELGRLVAHCRPRFIAMGEYDSWFHRTHGIEAPDRFVSVLARRLRVSLERWGYARSMDCDATLSSRGFDPHRWLLYTPRPRSRDHSIARSLDRSVALDLIDRRTNQRGPS